MNTNHLSGKLFRVKSDFVFCEKKFFDLSDGKNSYHSVISINHTFKKNSVFTIINKSSWDPFDIDFENYYDVFFETKIVKFNVSYLCFCERFD